MLRRTGRALLAGALLALAGCSVGSSSCRYGSSGDGSCNVRPKPSAEQEQAAMSGAALRAGLRAYLASRHPARVNSVGVNKWGETTFTVRVALGGPHEYRLTTYDAGGRRTSGDEEYTSEPDDPFPLRRVHPGALVRAVAAIRARQPDAILRDAVLTVAPFSNELAWNIQIINDRAPSSLVYQVLPDGSHLCHGEDVNPQDKLVIAPGIPRCADPVMALG